MEAHFRILDVTLTLAGPRPAVAPIASAYRRFRAEHPGTVRINADTLPPLGDLDPAFGLYQRFLRELMGGIASHAVLHAAALADGSGRAILLAGPSGHGKSSLTLELAHRGAGFLGDDYAPLDTGAGRIAPYPRAVGIVPGGDAPLPAPFRAAAAAAADSPLLGKKLLDVGEVLGEDRVVRTPRPLGHVLLLCADESEPPPVATGVLVGARSSDAAELDAAFAAIAGVRVERRAEEDPLAYWILHLDHAAAPTRALSPVLDSELVLFADKRWEVRPAFDRPPAAIRISRREAAESLGRELLNRRAGGALVERYGGDLTALFLEVAGSLREAACWRLRVGELGPTADLVQELTE